MDFSEDLSKGTDYLVKYEGTFNQNKKNGIGYLHFNNRTMFLGEFKDDQANGFGVYYKKSGGKICGAWNNGKLKKLLN